jgi:hypothetical protein
MGGGRRDVEEPPSQRGRDSQLAPAAALLGELTQWDTSDHDWLEGRGEPVRYLVRMIDDATSRNWGRFVHRDGTHENMGVLWEYPERYGRMADVFSPKAHFSS